MDKKAGHSLAECHYLNLLKEYRKIAELGSGEGKSKIGPTW